MQRRAVPLLNLPGQPKSIKETLEGLKAEDGSVIVHVFTQEAHDYYDLEHLWADAKPVPASEWMPEQPENEQ